MGDRSAALFSRELSREDVLNSNLDISSATDKDANSKDKKEKKDKKDKKVKKEKEKDKKSKKEPAKDEKPTNNTTKVEAKTEEPPSVPPERKPDVKPTQTSELTSPPPVKSISQSFSVGERILPEDMGGPPEIDPKEIEYNKVKDFLGAGSFGKVYVGRCRGKKVAVKVPSKQELSQKELDDFRNEVIIMKKIFHPNVVSLLGTCSIMGELKIVTELLHTDLEKLLKSNRTLTMYQKMKMAKDAALGMNWLHGITNLIHRDLKPANLLVDENLNVKITDFGFSQLKERFDVKDENGIARGTPLWMAPEVMLGRKFNEKCDVYSYAIILWQILTREEPFAHYNDFRKFRAAVCGNSCERPTIPEDTLPRLEELINRCWHPEYTERPSFKEIIASLDEIILETVITVSEDARAFWKQYFLTPRGELQETVPWNDFLQRIQIELVYKNDGSSDLPAKPDFHPDTFKNLKQLLAEKTLDDKFVVTMLRFNTVTQWFGPFFKKGPRAKIILDEIQRIVSEDWFHSDISKEDAEKRLANRPPGTFLVRLSSTTPEFPFTISMIGGQHRRIQYQVGEALLKGSTQKYKSLVDLITDSSNIKPAIDLRIPCPKNILNPMWGYESEK